MRILGAVLISLLLTALTGPRAMAADGHGAIVLKDLQSPFGCFIEEGLVTSIPLFTDGVGPRQGIHTVATPSGNVKLICNFVIPEGFAPAQAMKATGFECGIFLPTGSVFTANTTALATPGGEAKLECTIKAGQL